MSENGGPQSAQRKKAYALSREIGLTRAERIDLASYVLRRDVESWDALSEVQIVRILDALDGFVLVTALFSARAPAQP